MCFFGTNVNKKSVAAQMDSADAGLTAALGGNFVTDNSR